MRLARIGGIGAVIAGIFALRGSRRRPPPAPPSTPTRKRSPVDEASMESFPASDPPSWTLGTDRDR